MNEIVLTLSLAFLFLISCTSPKYNLNNELKKNSHTNQLIYKIDSIVVENMNKYEIPGLSIGIVKNGSTFHTSGYGVKNINTKEAVHNNSVFHAASISKLFTAHAIINLIDEGKLNLEDKIIEIVPQIKSSDDRFNVITIKNLLNHTSGIPDIKNYKWQKYNQSKNALKNYILSKDFKLKSYPSKVFHYSNLGYDLLGFIVETVSGTTFEDYVESSILNTYGMNESDFKHFSINNSIKVSPHSKKKISSKIYVRKHYPYTREHSPSSTLNTSGKELCHWMNFITKDLNKKGDKSIIYKMTQPSTDLNNYIGLGFQLFEIESYKAIGHYGGDKGFRSYLFMIPEKEIGLVLLANCDYNEGFREDILHSILKLLLD